MGDVYMVNGKILSGLPNHAKDIIFDNDGTTLSSTNTEDAIKEVSSNLSQLFNIHTVTVTTGADGSASLPVTSGYKPIALHGCWHRGLVNSGGIWLTYLTSYNGDNVISESITFDIVEVANSYFN